MDYFGMQCFMSLDGPFGFPRFDLQQWWKFVIGILCSGANTASYPMGNDRSVCGDKPYEERS
jgi:hypothetical protein